MKISFIFILFLFCSLHSYGTTPKIKVYCNPVLAKSTPDPTVIQAPDGMFYLYATEDIHNIPIYKSPDLVNWTFVGTAFTDATRPTFEPKAGLWAPDINHIDGKYVLYYAMSRWGGEHTCGIGCAVADSPAGPFTDQGKLFRSNEIGVQNSIDPFYIEENGEKYLFWGSFRGIYYIELSEDGLHIRPGAKPTQIAGICRDNGILQSVDASEHTGSSPSAAFSVFCAHRVIRAIWTGSVSLAHGRFPTSSQEYCTSSLWRAAMVSSRYVSQASRLR